jgi:ribosomal protein L29
MKLDSLKRRIGALEPEGGMCPHCQALKAMSKEELDARIQALTAGQSVLADLPDPSPFCPRCQKAATMSEEELDAELASLWIFCGWHRS